jgi:hypothetical protein
MSGFEAAVWLVALIWFVVGVVVGAAGAIAWKPVPRASPKEHGGCIDELSRRMSRQGGLSVAARRWARRARRTWHADRTLIL